MRSMNTRLATRPAAGGASSIDDRDARLAALAARRPAGSPASSTARPAGTASGRARRRHAAHGSRIASLGISVASTGALAAFFAMSNAGTGNQVQAATIVSGAAVTGGTTAAAATPVTAAAAAPVATAAPATVDLAVPAVGAVQTVAPVTAAATLPATTPATTLAVAAATPTVVQGGVFTNKWGDVQVQATFAADGSLVEVVTLQTPDADGKSVRINDRAVPVLNQEALTIQNANVDTVSGATYTSNDYRRSLQSAIDVARAAGVTTLARPEPT